MKKGTILMEVQVKNHSQEEENKKQKNIHQKVNTVQKQVFK